MLVASGEEKTRWRRKKKRKKKKQWSHAPSVGCILTVHSEIQKAVKSAQNAV